MRYRSYRHLCFHNLRATSNRLVYKKNLSESDIYACGRPFWCVSVFILSLLFRRYINVLLVSDCCCVSFSCVTGGMRKPRFISAYRRRQEVCLLAGICFCWGEICVCVCVQGGGETSSTKMFSGMKVERGREGMSNPASGWIIVWIKWCVPWAGGGGPGGIRRLTRNRLQAWPRSLVLHISWCIMPGLQACVEWKPRVMLSSCWDGKYCSKQYWLVCHL